jgi:hypothetical protein
MPRTFAGFVTLLALLDPLSPGKAVAGPPEGASGKVAFDEVADGLRKYRKEMDPDQRRERLVRLSRTRDPRVGIALGEALSDANPTLVYSAASLYLDYFSTEVSGYRYRFPVELAREQWEKKAADLRRRAKHLPR